MPRRFEQPRMRYPQLEQAQKQSFRALSLQYHGDHNSDNDNAQKIINHSNGLYAKYQGRFLQGVRAARDDERLLVRK